MIRGSFQRLLRPLLSALVVIAIAGAAGAQPKAPQAPLSTVEPRVISIDIPPPTSEQDSAGGVLVADVNDDAKMDFLVTVPGHLAVYGNDGAKLWVARTDIVVGGQAESKGLPGHHGPGVAAGDVDGDGKCEVVYLTLDGTLHVVDGATGRPKAAAKPPVPSGAARWELAVVATFRGTDQADQDILLQATNAKGYRTGKYLAAYAMKDLLAGGKPLWETDRFLACAHNGARLADLDGDGRDEVLGGEIWSHDGRRLVEPVAFEGHIDSVFAYDVQPERPGIEVVILEEGSNRVQLLGLGGPIWRSHLRGQEPQNASVGRFKEGSDAMYVWCRSRHNKHQTPFVFDPAGRVVSEYKMDDVALRGWTDSGVEVIHTIDWTGGPTQLACAKERHESGDVGIFEPLTGRFVARFPDKSDRLYVADIAGDWREEVVVLAGSELHIYANPAANPRPGAKRLWDDHNYRRRKHCHNYYSP